MSKTLGKHHLYFCLSNKVIFYPLLSSRVGAGDHCGFRISQTNSCSELQESYRSF
jgi:hypothetical protein